LLLLSCIKVLSVSIDVPVPTTVYDIHGKPLPNLYLYYDGSTEYFGREHLPFANYTMCGYSTNLLKVIHVARKKMLELNIFMAL